MTNLSFCGIVEETTKGRNFDMGLFGNSKRNKEIINNFSSQILKQQEIIDNLTKENTLLRKEHNKNKSKKEYKDNIFELNSGEYIGDVDIPAGIYDLKILFGYGTMEIKSFNQIFFRLSEETIGNSTEYNYVSIYRGTYVKIEGYVKVQFKLRQESFLENEIRNLKKEKFELTKEIEYARELQNSEKINSKSKFVLCSGKYRGDIDIPVGMYSLKIISGYGLVQIDEPDNIWFWMYSDEKEAKKNGGIKTYKNLEISEKSILKIWQSATIEFSASKKCDFSEEYSNSKEETETKPSKVKEELESEKYDIEYELNILREELKKLNDECIRKYYQFSSYESLTSQDCKNELAILKQREIKMRREEKDIVKQNGVKMEPKDKRIARQMLRTFNAECDNIMMNISLKNIDKVRNQIQKSFETINTIYTNGNWINHSLLELKLQQATLIYTYELKYQQEKEIQRAIKEQMLEEAKAEKEIEQQKKKIEKDLQQHLGEVNRMMKYMQKTQIDAEKQLYLDKIKELEEKIKLLEADKETVSERQANAKAGFVYVISNIGSFGEGIYKIGMTRRLEPMERIRELSSASVPFEFDVHAMIFSSNAPELETMLHKHFSDRAVNKVNPRKEFFRVDIDEIERVVKENYNDTVQFTKIPVATEYRQSMDS